MRITGVCYVKNIASYSGLLLLLLHFLSFGASIEFGFFFKMTKPSNTDDKGIHSSEASSARSP